ncbi:MAG: hypothetical protein L0Z62_27120 [Gemmataceae bacterium]|nr:hypothetical protein [Gemmataceae bacterium]
MTPDNEDGFLPFEDEVTELSVLLSGQQALNLEQAAHERGLTTAQMIRALIRDFLQRGRWPRTHLANVVR